MEQRNAYGNFWYRTGNTESEVTPEPKMEKQTTAVEYGEAGQPRRLPGSPRRLKRATAPERQTNSKERGLRNPLKVIEKK